MKLTEKTKRYLAIGGGTVVCIGLLAAISLQFAKAPAGEDTLPEESGIVAEIVVDPGGGDTVEGATDIEKETAAAESTEGSGLVIQPGAGTAAGNGESSQPVDSRPAQTDQTEQSIQPEPTKPETPDEEVLKDPTTKPDGTKVEGTPEVVEHDHVEKPDELPVDPDEPQAGDTSGGQIYIPGFGWVENHGGGGSGTVAEDMYENGNKIGIMD